MRNFGFLSRIDIHLWLFQKVLFYLFSAETCRLSGLIMPSRGRIRERILTLSQYDRNTSCEMALLCLRHHRKRVLDLLVIRLKVGWISFLHYLQILLRAWEKQEYILH